MPVLFYPIIFFIILFILILTFFWVLAVVRVVDIIYSLKFKAFGSEIYQ